MITVVPAVVFCDCCSCWCQRSRLRCYVVGSGGVACVSAADVGAVVAGDIDAVGSDINLLVCLPIYLVFSLTHCLLLLLLLLLLDPTDLRSILLFVNNTHQLYMAITTGKTTAEIAGGSYCLVKSMYLDTLTHCFDLLLLLFLLPCHFYSPAELKCRILQLSPFARVCWLQAYKHHFLVAIVVMMVMFGIGKCRQLC